MDSSARHRRRAHIALGGQGRTDRRRHTIDRPASRRDGGARRTLRAVPDPRRRPQGSSPATAHQPWPRSFDAYRARRSRHQRARARGHREPPRKLTDTEIDRLVTLAAFIVRARTAVERDGYDREVQLLPAVEAPGRLVGSLAALLNGIEAVGADLVTAWRIVERAAWGCVPEIRIAILRHLRDHPGSRSADLVAATGMPRTTAERAAEDLALIGLVARTKQGGNDNAAWRWDLTDQARTDWP